MLRTRVDDVLLRGNDRPARNHDRRLGARSLARRGAIAPEEADVWLFVGTNPVISKQFIGENPARQLHHAVERGMKLLVIDPRRTETARLAHVHLQPRPNEDATLVAGILHVLLRDNCVDDSFIRENVDGLELLRRMVEPFTPEYVAPAEVPSTISSRRLGHRERASGGTGAAPASA